MLRFMQAHRCVWMTDTNERDWRQCSLTSTFKLPFTLQLFLPVHASVSLCLHIVCVVLHCRAVCIAQLRRHGGDACMCAAAGDGQDIGVDVLESVLEYMVRVRPRHVYRRELIDSLIGSLWDFAGDGSGAPRCRRAVYVRRNPRCTCQQQATVLWFYPRQAAVTVSVASTRLRSLSVRQQRWRWQRCQRRRCTHCGFSAVLPVGSLRPNATTTPQEVACAA